MATQIKITLTLDGGEEEEQSIVKCEFLICRYFQKGKYISTKDCYMI